MTDEAIALLAPRIGTRAACTAVGVAQATWYRRHRASPPPPRRPAIAHRNRAQPRALTAAERRAILDMLHSDRFAGTSPAEAWATLLDEGTYLGSQSTFYRLLRQAGETRERRAQAAHPAAVKPELATAGSKPIKARPGEWLSARRRACRGGRCGWCNLAVPGFPAPTADIDRMYRELLSVRSGAVADYIPRLRRVDPEQLVSGAGASSRSRPTVLPRSFSCRGGDP